MELLISLLLAHLVADFYVQKTQWVECRNKYHFHSKGLLKHILSHFSFTFLTVLFYQSHFLSAFFAALVITSMHYFIDVWKSYTETSDATVDTKTLLQQQSARYKFIRILSDMWALYAIRRRVVNDNKEANRLIHFLTDQGLHVLSIIFVWGLLNGADWSIVQAILFYFWNEQTLFTVMAYVLLAKPCSILISTTLNRYSEEQTTGLISAGELIGILERWLILSFILVNQFAGVGFLLAAKTIFRFGDLTKSADQKMTEYMLLGTLISFFAALAVGWITIQFTG